MRRQSDPSGRDRLLEAMAALMLGIATLCSAWFIFQASRWNDREGDEAQRSLEQRIEASRLFTLGAQKIAYDAAMAAQYAAAYADGRTDLQRFYRDTLMRPEFLPILNAWEEQARSGGGGASNLLQNAEYRKEQLSDSTAADAAAAAATIRGDQASQNANGFTQATIFATIALFLAGLTSNFRDEFVRIALLSGAVIAIAIGAASVADLPMLV